MRRCLVVAEKVLDGVAHFEHLAVEQVATVETFIGAHPMPSLSNWQAVQTSLVKLRQAFGLST